MKNRLKRALSGKNISHNLYNLYFNITEKKETNLSEEERSTLLEYATGCACEKEAWMLMLLHGPSDTAIKKAEEILDGAENCDLEETYSRTLNYPLTYLLDNAEPDKFRELVDIYKNAKSSFLRTTVALSVYKKNKKEALRMMADQYLTIGCDHDSAEAIEETLYREMDDDLRSYLLQRAEIARLNDDLDLEKSLRSIPGVIKFPGS